MQNMSKGGNLMSYNSKIIKDALENPILTHNCGDCSIRCATNCAVGCGQTCFASCARECRNGPGMQANNNL